MHGIAKVWPNEFCKRILFYFEAVISEILFGPVWNNVTDIQYYAKAEEREDFERILIKLFIEGLY